MKFNFGLKSYTFVVIPDAQGTVARVRIPLIVLVGVPLIILSMILYTVYLYNIHTKTVLAAEMLQAEIDESTVRYKETITQKDEAIAQLQDDVISLSSQAEQIKQTVDKLKELERDILNIDQTDTAGKPSDKGRLAIASFDQSGGIGGGGIGGGLSFAADDVGQIVNSTMTDFTNLDEVMESLYHGLIAAKDKVYAELQQSLVTPSIWPTKSKKISSTFGYRKDPFSKRLTMHAGIDLSGAIGDPVYATADGKVSGAGRDGGHGNSIIVNHGNGLKTRYSHLSKILVKKGESVKKGDKIGLLGSTGRSTGPHLHYEVIKNGKNIDPAPYMQQR